ncbi:MAG TPA: hypothetical protein VFV76_07030 [Actinomycetes bacterium]|nr:hypothetical protein [Actinomycetes bacterium]
MTEGLSPALHRRAVLQGPRAVASSQPQPELLRRAGFTDVVATDVTDDYLRTSEAWVAENERYRDELRPPDAEGYDQRLADNRTGVAAIRDGLLRRWLLVARRPGG